MALIPTKQLFDEMFAETDQEYVRKTRTQADRPEVYAYEKKIGKQLVDMNVDELFDMIGTFNEDGFSISYSSYDSIAVIYRKAFQYYIDHYEVIRNPWADKRMKGAAAHERIAQNKAPFTWEYVEHAIEELYRINEPDRARYVECIMRLYYNGFERAEEIVLMKENMVDLNTQTVRLSGRTVQLDPKCFSLLVEIHNMDVMKGWRGDYVMASWHGSYFKFSIRPSEEATFNDRPLSQICNLINRTISERIRKGVGVDINYRLLYLLGFYNFLVKTYGKETTNRILTSVRVKEDLDKLAVGARLYGITSMTQSQIKKAMRPFITD